MAFSPDGATLATASNDQTVRLWEASGGAALATLAVGSPVVALAWGAEAIAVGTGVGRRRQ